ncbi:MAG: radical SAM protein [Candidatus Omnitrophica bacterium]|nr:radical SAM protein [Candidatus Omnitrophota bacterium]
MSFRPVEVLFAPSALCNLSCAHCGRDVSTRALSVDDAVRFLGQCAKAGIRKVGFTGGEPFLRIKFLCAISKEVVKSGLEFDRIMTNGVWWKTKKDLRASLLLLKKSGFDGSLCVSVDAFHRQKISKVASFIRSAAEIWGRPDVVSVASVTGASDARTIKKISDLARVLGGRFTGFSGSHPRISSDTIFVKIMKIDLSPVGAARDLKDPWDGSWFREDRCKGPGNVFFVTPSGDIKPCCGYATDSARLTIGNIRRDGPVSIMRRLPRNRVVSTIWDSGLSSIRKRLERCGVRFPGKTSNHCFFCHYILNEIPFRKLSSVLD